LHSKLQFLYSLRRLGIKTGLEHTLSLLNHVDNPHKTFPSIHVAGTNGKGSTCSMISSILKNMNLKVGIYTSPHLIRFNERIRVNNIEISDEYICSFIERNEEIIKQIKSTFFETTTAMAFSYFKDQEVDVAIIETGLGGRLDSTNVLHPQVAVLTSISLDHTKILGCSLEKIAIEKCGIIKKNIPVVSAIQRKKVKLIIKNKTNELEAPYLEIEEPKKIVLTSQGTKFIHQNNHYETPLVGYHQAFNAVLAFEACNIFLNNLSTKQINNGLKKTVWQGRFQKICNDPPIYYDVAHNFDGILSTINSLKSIYKIKPLGLFVMKSDKEANLIIKAVNRRFDMLILSGSEENGLLPGNKLAKLFENYGFANFLLINDLGRAIDYLKKTSKEKNIPGLIFGSHYISETVFNKFGILT
tara:strand:+ start:501 stop:1742 length:1242 start_codon:yes stop_codon:yes gene_type:complete